MNRFLICGLGSIGRRHLRNLQSLGHSEIVLLRSGKSTLPDEELAGLPTEQDLAEALAKWRPSAVVVSNPTALHLEVALAAARAGCHILLEKPVSDTLQGVDELAREVEEQDVRLLVGFQFRFHPGLEALKRLLEDGAIGRPLSARVHWGEYLPGWHPWEDYRLSYSARADLGGGVLLTLCHPFDYLRWLFGEVEAVTAEAGKLGDLELEVEDTAEVLLAFREGPLVSVHLDYNQRPATHWLEIVGTKGTLRWEAEHGGVRWWAADLREWREVTPPAGFDRNHMFLKEMAHFVEVVEGRAEPRCTLQDGARALEIVIAAKQSAMEGQRVRPGRETD